MNLKENFQSRLFSFFSDWVRHWHVFAKWRRLVDFTLDVGTGVFLPAARAERPRSVPCGSLLEGTTVWKPSPLEHPVMLDGSCIENTSVGRKWWISEVTVCAAPLKWRPISSTAYAVWAAGNYSPSSMFCSLLGDDLIVTAADHNDEQEAITLIRNELYLLPWIPVLDRVRVYFIPHVL